MSDTRRSSRSRRQVNYCQFGDNDSEKNSDDDFAEPTPPSPKRFKVDKEKKKNSKLKSAKKKSGRVLEDEKIYDSDLELALALSKQASQELLPSGDEVTEAQTDTAKTEKFDNIRETKIEEKLYKEKKHSDEDSNFEPDFEDSEISDFDDDDDSDSDFNECATSKKSKGSSSKKKSCKRGKGLVKTTSKDSKSPIKARFSATVTPVNKPGKLTPKRAGSKIRPNVNLTAPTSRSASRENTELSNSNDYPAIRKPAWCASGNSSSNRLGGVTLKTPSAPIRLGLSRNIRVKPLHPHVQIK
ncbi:RAD51-associated protein 1-like isoform X2 [Ptychodera flava]|uniref:RAD51-associated protein 1-like isoform X2 n=1 Tax=Ptychodera flava TaxID=63121 RepID=UPI003969FD0E